MFISIDPGINFCSVVVIEPGKEFLVKESILVKNVRKFTEEEKEQEKQYGSRTVKVMAIIKTLEEQVDKYNPDFIVIEAPFYNSLTPSAYGSLLEVIFAVKYLVTLKRDLKIHLMEPRLVKKFFTENGNAAKQMMKEYLTKKLNNKDIILESHIEEETLSEHEIDGIAIGYTYWTYVKQTEET